MAQSDDIEKMEFEMDREESDEQQLRLMDKAIRRFRTTFAVIVIAFATAGTFYFGLPETTSLGKIRTEMRGSTALAAGLLVLIKVLIDSRIRDIEADKKIILARRRVKDQLNAPSGPKEESGTDETDDQSPEDTYFDNLVKINVENLAAYYELVKIQTDKSFRASLGIAYFGGALIIIGLVLGFYRSDATDKVTYIASGSGVLTEFIAGVFFWLYSKTVSQLRGYHDSLISVQNILLSFKLVSDTRDPKEKAQMVSKMCSYLLAGLPKAVASEKQRTAPKPAQPKPAAKATAAADAPE